MSYQPKRTWKIATEPATEPFTTAVAKTHLRVDIDADDTIIDSQTAAVRKEAELFTRRAFVTQTWDLWLDHFPCNADNDVILIPNPPLASVTHVKYYNSSGTLTTLTEDTDYTVDTDSEPGRITPYYNTSWPTTRGMMNAVNVRFICGYGAAAAVPEMIKAAIKLRLGGLYENRESETDIKIEENSAAGRLLWQFRIRESY